MSAGAPPLITRAEWRWVALGSLAVVAFTCLPYLFGWYITAPGFQYMGLLANPDEQNVYLGWMRQAERGRLLFSDPFTTEPQQAGFFHIFFLLLGWKARLAHLPLIWVFHLTRVVCGLALLCAAYWLAAEVFAARFTRRLAWALVALSSGFGWIHSLLRPQAALNPIDFGAGLVMPEAITFLSLLINPLFCFSVFLMIVVFAGYLAAIRTRCRWPVLAAAAAALVLGNAHTYDVFPIWAALAGHVAVVGAMRRRPPLREGALAAIIAAAAVPFVVYQYWLFQANPVFRDKALTPTPTPPWPYFLSGYGLVAMLAAPGALAALRRRSEGQALLVAWAAATLALVFLAPVSFQRKMAEGLHLPLSLLAAGWVGAALSNARATAARAMAIALVAAVVPSNLFFAARGVRDLVQNNAAYVSVLMPPLYLRQDVVAAMNWLRANSAMEDAVLCMPLEGSYLPGVAGNTVFVGHWAETLHYPRKLSAMRRFFAADTEPAQRRAMMENHGLRYVLYTRYEQAAGAFDPRTSPEFEPLFDRPEATVLALTAEP